VCMDSAMTERMALGLALATLAGEASFAALNALVVFVLLAAFAVGALSTQNASAIKTL